jgi:uncharacterized caspase-like protein
MEDAENGVNVIVLDACRNNPFTRSFRSSQRGLAVTQAITGSLIAYATAPGSAAADGSGRNGVYTSHLLQNMRMPGVPIEQVFKNVRIGVMKETGNKQIPWETSSLIGNVTLRSTAENPTSLGEIQDQVEAQRQRVQAEQQRLEEERRLRAEQQKLQAEQEWLRREW